MCYAQDPTAYAPNSQIVKASSKNKEIRPLFKEAFFKCCSIAEKLPELHGEDLRLICLRLFIILFFVKK